MRPIIIAAAAAALLVLAGSGCSSFSTVNPRAMTTDDIISMSKSGAGAEVIKDQIIATESRFRLSPQDIVRLKGEGVSDDVVRAMIGSGDTPESYSREYGVSPYDFWFDYYMDYPTYGYPYEVWRRPGLVGRFYNYYPATPYDRYGPWSFRMNPLYSTSDSTGVPLHPGTGQPMRVNPWHYGRW